MDLGIKGRKAIVCAASKGLGRGCAEHLAREGVELTICARTADILEQTAADIRKATGVKVTAVACDITTDAGRKAVLAACPAPDILINNAGGPPPGDFKTFSLDDWRAAVESNMITPIALIHATVYGMMDRGFGRILNITSQSVKAPIAQLELSNGARSGLHGAVAIIARRAAARNVTINNILPGPFDTDRLRGTHQEDGRGAQRAGRGNRGRAQEISACRPVRQHRRVRRDGRLHVLQARRLHDRPEHPDGRRRLPRRDVVLQDRELDFARVP